MTEVSNLGNPGAANLNGNTPPAPTPIAKPDPIVLGGDNYDMDALKDFSRSQAEQRLKENPNLYGVIKGKKDEKESKEESTEEEVEETSSDEEQTDEAGEDEVDASSAEPSDSEEEEEGQEEPEELEDGEEVDGRKYVVAKAGDKALRVPKGATFEIKVDGKVESISVQEALNRASGGIHIERETTRLGRERKALEGERMEFSKKARIVNDNTAMLLELCETKGPEEVAAFYAYLVGKDPGEVYEQLERSVCEEIQKYQGLTDSQRSLIYENRRLRLASMANERRARSEEQFKAQETERLAVRKEMERHGVSDEDWSTYLTEAKKRLEAKELEIEIKTPADAINYIVGRKLEVKVDQAIQAVNPNLKDSKFRAEVIENVAQAESILRRAMPPEKIQALVRSSIDTKKKALSDTLSKKAARVKESGRPTSQSGKSPKQEKKREPILLRDHYDRINGIS